MLFLKKLYILIIQLFIFYIPTTMVIKDSKKIEHADERGEITKELSLIKSLKLVSQQKKDELIKDLLGQKKLTETRKESSYEHLLNKPNMTPKDKENMEKSIRILINNKMDTEENLQKLDAIKYGSDYREIAWLKFSRKTLVPKRTKFNAFPNENNIFDSNTKGIYKVMCNGNPKYFFTPEAYAKETMRQLKKSINADHIRKALEALPWDFKYGEYYTWGNILWTILDLPTDWYVNWDGWTSTRHNRNGESAFLTSTSLIGTSHIQLARALWSWFTSASPIGGLIQMRKMSAFQSLYLIR